MRSVGGALICVAIAHLFGHAAHADWYVAGAQYSCGVAGAGQFELVPYEQASYPTNSPHREGFTVLQDGASDFKCRIGNRTLAARITVIPPQARGMCMGGGMVDIESFAVDDVELMKNRRTFNW